MSYTPLELAEAFLRAGELADALDALHQHLAAHPDDQAARRMRAQVYAGMAASEPNPDHVRAALADLEMLIPLTVDDVIRRVSLLRQLNEVEKAHQLLNGLWGSADKIGRDPRLIELLLESLYQRHEPARAIEILFHQPKTWRWLRWTGDFHALKGDYRVALDYFCSALDQLDESTQEPPTSAVGFIGNLRGQILLRRADMYQKIALYAEAAADYEEAEKLIPNDASIPLFRGMALYLGGDMTNAINICRRALDRASEMTRTELIGQLKTDSRYSGLAQSLNL